MTAPTFVDGQPANLEAAALDALEWLKFWERNIGAPIVEAHRPEAKRRMGAAIESLSRFLPDEGEEPVLYLSATSGDGAAAEEKQDER